MENNNNFETGMILDAVPSTPLFSANEQLISEVGGEMVPVEEAQSPEVLQQALSNSPSYQMLQYMKPRTKVREYKKVGRNESCPCGSGLKYKNCCMESGKYEEYKNQTRHTV